MGIVYLAHDPRLGRKLAIKVLPEHFARDPQRLHRLRREARILASLNHPNIATIYRLVEQDDGRVAMVLEYLEGEDLGERLRRGPLRGEESVRICRQVADALDAAHERGVIHLDLKPGNVMVTSKGLVKLMDFGISRTDRPISDSATTETVSLGSESSGVVSGTPGYMSPEQARGQPLDHRADVFAFGCLVFECLTGQRAFQSRTVWQVLDRTASGDPDWDLLPAETPPEIRPVLEACLNKDQDQRPSSIREAWDSISSILEDRSSAVLAPIVPGPATPNNLPVAVTTFVGRRRELEELLRLMRSSSRLVTLTGAGGCGKTRLALQLAGRLLSDHPDGVWLVDLSAVNDPAHVTRLAASVLGIEEDPGRPELEGLVARLRDRKSVILLDNCEHLLQACAGLVSALLRGCPGVRVLATSRQRLAVAGEQDYLVPSLALPDVSATGAVTPPAQVDSVRLFVERARAVRPDWSLTGRDETVVAEICRRLDGIPLAIELGAARIRVLSPEQILAKLDDRFRLLTEAAVGRPPRHQTLRATLDWSYGLLEPEEQRLLRGMSVFAGGWTLEAATAIWGRDLDEFAVLDLTTHLVDKSLALAERGPDQEARFRFLETVREYAFQKLTDAGEATDLQSRHLDYFVALVEQAASHFRDRTQGVWFRRLEADHGNILAALDRSMKPEQGDERGLRLVGAIWPFWAARGQMRAGLAETERTLAHDPSTKPSMTRAKARAAAGCLAIHLGDYETARVRHEEVLTICRELADQRGIARALGNLGLVALDLEEYAAARPRFEECLEIFRALGDQHGIAATLGNLAIVLRNQGDVAGARKLQEENLRLTRELGDLHGQLIASKNLAIISFDEGDFDRCRAQLHESLSIARGLESRADVADNLAAASMFLHDLKQTGPALQMLAAVVAMRDQMGVRPQPHAEREEAKLMKEAREILGGKQFVRAWEAGSRMSFHEAAAFGLQCLDARRDESETSESETRESKPPRA